jgi:cyclopropane-fatty-acyl-phospholipid synthase
MSESGDASTAGMKGEGYYDAHSEYQRRVIEGGDPLIRESAAAVLPAAAEALTVVDYGSGTGATSVHAVRTAIEAIRGRDPSRPVQVIHNDVAGNDFTGLFAKVTGEDGYLGIGGAPIFAGAAVGSFFDQVLPSGTAHLGMCSNAAHWLRRQPEGVDIPGGMYFSDASGDAREALAAQAADDWLRFLTARAAELAPGGRLVVQGIATMADGRASASKLLGVMWQAAEELVAEGKLDREALAGYVFPVYCRTEAEAVAPVAEAGPLAADLKLVSAVVEEVANPYWEQYERDGDGGAYAATYVQFVRAFAESSLSEHLFEPGATGVDPAQLCDDYFARLERLTAADPDAGRYECWILRISFQR